MQTLVPVSFLLISIALTPDTGFFRGDQTPIYLLTISWILLILSILPSRLRASPSPFMPAIILLINALIFTTHIRGGWTRTFEPFDAITQIVWFTFVLNIFFIVISYGHLICRLFPVIKKIIPFQRKILLSLWILLVGISVVLRVLMIRSSPSPPIDVFFLLKEGAQFAFSGKNPYTSMFSPVFPGVTPDYYPYWPASFILHIPGVLLTGDPRYLHVAADIASGILLAAITNFSPMGLIISLLHLYRPHALLLIEGSWLTSLNNFNFILGYYLIIKKKSFLSALVMGLSSATQFFNVLSAGFLALLSKKPFRYGFIVFFILSIFLIPYLILSGREVYEKTIHFYFLNPPHPAVVPHWSLSLNTLYFLHTGHDMSPIVAFAISAIFILTAIFIKNKTPLKIASMHSLSFFSVFLFGRQAFVNYHYFTATLLLVWMCFLFGKNADS